MNDSWKDTIVRVSRPVRITVTIVLVMLALFLLVMTIDGLHNWGHEDSTAPNTITVTGHGSATAIPDTATITFTAMATGADVATAESKMTDTTNTALNAIKAEGVSSDDVTTLSYNVSPHYSSPVCGPGIICQTTSVAQGYDVSESVQVKVHDTTKVSAVLGELAKANVTDVNGPDLVVNDPQVVQGQARKQAIDKATSDAKLLASQLGVHLGKITDFEDNTGGGATNPEPMFKAAGDVASPAAAPSIPVGNNEYTDDVSITYAIN